jgi:DNA-binding CsgD family transcriptional regulator
MSFRSFEQETLGLVATTVRASRLCAYRVGPDLEPYGHDVWGGDTRWIQPYITRYRALDPMHPRYFAQHVGSVFRITDSSCDEAQYQRYRDGFQRPLGIRFKAEMFLRDHAGHIIGGVRISRQAELGEFAATEMATLAALQPVLSLALVASRSAERVRELEANLTGREREILHWLLAGVPNKAICRDVGLALPTVKCHIKNVLRKAGAANRADLIGQIYRGTV